MFVHDNIIQLQSSYIDLKKLSSLFYWVLPNHLTLMSKFTCIVFCQLLQHVRRIQLNINFFKKYQFLSLRSLWPHFTILPSWTLPFLHGINSEVGEAEHSAPAIMEIQRSCLKTEQGRTCPLHLSNYSPFEPWHTPPPCRSSLRALSPNLEVRCLLTTESLQSSLATPGTKGQLLFICRLHKTGAASSVPRGLSPRLWGKR